MVNMKKWEEVDFFDINVGEEIKTVNVEGAKTTSYQGTVQRTLHDEGRISGTITIRKGDHVHRLIRGWEGKPAGVTLYRRKPVNRDKAFVFPTGAGAVVEMTYKLHTPFSPRKFTYTGTVWVASDIVDAKHRDEAYLRENYKNFKLISEGVE